MTSIKRRIPPTQDAAEHAAKASDKTGKLEVKFINPYKGRGVFATTLFNKGDFVVEYRGELIHYEEAQRRRTLYHSACAVFMFDFLWQERCWCIDASREDNTLGRLVNDDDINPNCRIKKILVDGKPHLCLFAIRDINPGEEITYNYGGTDWPWRKKVDKESPVTESVEVENAGSSDQAPPRKRSSKKKVDKESPVTESVEVENAGSSDQAPPKSSKKKVDKESPVTESVEVENAGSSDQAPPRKRSSKKKVDKESPVTESVEVENAGSSDQAPPKSSKKKVDKESPVTESVEVENAGSSDQAPPKSSKKKVDKESPVTESVEVENAGSSDQAPPRKRSSKKKVDKESPVTESVEVENAGSSDQAPPKSSKKKVDKESPVTESVEVENAGSSDQAPPRKRSSKKKVDKESPVTESVEVENAGSSDQAPPRKRSSKKKVDKESPVTESVEVENAGSSDQAPPKSSKKKVDKESPVTESVEVENAGSSDQAPPKSSKKKVDKESPVTESVEVENAGSSDQAPPRKRSSKKKVDKESPVTESVEVENAGSSDQAPPKSSKKKVDKESPVTESVEVENAGSSDQAPPKSSKKKVDKESPVTESVEVENAGSSDQAPPRKRSSKKKVDKESPVTESVEVENAGSSDQAPPKSSKKKVVKESPVTESVEVENAGSSDQAPPRKRSSKKKKHCSRSSPDSSSSYDDHLPIPKLRRTKSIFMNKLDPFESDDLFDPSSNDSEEEYVPKSGEEYSEDTDTSDIMEPDDLKSILFSRFNKTGEFPVGCTPVIEQNNNKSSEQGLHRGRSPTKKHKKFPKYKRRHFSPSLCRTKCIGEAQSAEVETGSSSEKDSSATSGPVAEDHGPSGSYSSVESDGLPKVSAFIPAVGKSSDGSRIYNKKQYCLYCKKGFIKIARHLERAHHNKPEVAQAIAFAKGSRERRLHLEHLRNRGNFTHNVEVLNSGAGTLVPRKQPRTISEPQNYLHCTYCQGLFTKKVLWRHMVICKFKPNVDKKPGRTRVQALCAFAVPPPPGVKTEFWKLLNTMNQDEVYTAVKSDELIKEYGQHLYNRLGHDASRHEYIRQKMRELGRLLIHSRKTTPMKTIEEHIKPANFMLVVESVKNLAGFSVETNTYKCPSLALKIGYSLTKISQLVESRANVQKNYSAAKDARAFRNVYESRWNEFVSAASLRTLQESKWNAPQLLPFTKDVQTLHSYLSEQQQHFYTELSAEASPQTWTNLAKVTLTQVILFNRRRSGEVSKMPLSAYLSSNPSSDQDDLKEALSDLEKKLCEHFRRLEIRGKRGRKVPVLLSPEMQQSLDMLVSKRQECGIPKENAHLFARPSAMSHYRGSDCLRHFASTCGAKRPDTLTSTKLRKQTATLSQILNLSNTELDQLANFLGHDIRVHRQFYRLPEGTLQLAKISKVLMALEQGRLAEFKGKSLDDITIDPEENVKLDSEEEAEIESDPKEDQVASIGHQILDVDNRNAETQDTRTLSQTCKSKSPKKGKSRQPCKRRTWEKAEVLAVEKHLMPFINTCRVPGKTDCENCLKQEPVALRHRNWLAIKFYVKNRITALKNKV